MADRYAVKSGVWSDPDTWDGGTLPEPGDTVRPSGRTVEIDMDIEVDLLTNNASSPASSGGWFEVSTVPDLTIEADVVGWSSTAVFVRVPTVIVGDVQSGSAGSRGVTVDGASVEIIGHVRGSGGHNGHGVYVFSASAKIIGDVTGGIASGNNVSNGVYLYSGSVEVIGDVIGDNSSAVHVAGGVADISGTVEASTTPAVTGSSYGLVRFTGPLINSPTGVSACAAERWMIREDHNFEWQVTNDSTAPVSGDPVHLTVWNDHTPPPEDTRAGHVYGHGGTLTGTLDVPPPESVAAGVPTDDTAGTAALAPSDVWDLQPDRLKNVATVATTGAQLEAALDTGDDS